MVWNERFSFLRDDRKIEKIFFKFLFWITKFTVNAVRSRILITHFLLVVIPYIITMHNKIRKIKMYISKSIISSLVDSCSQYWYQGIELFHVLLLFSYTQSILFYHPSLLATTNLVLIDIILLSHVSIALNTTKTRPLKVIFKVTFRDWLLHSV